VGIHDDNVITGDQEWRILRSMLSIEYGSRFRRDTSKDLVGRIDHVPFVDCGQLIRG
jgi:hypothetical protein